MRRTFTLDEANALLPVLEPLLRTALDCHHRFEEVQQEFQRINHHVFLAGGTLLKISEMLALKGRWENHAEELRKAVGEIEQMGVLIKDLVLGLLDFPCRLDEEIILLCWKLGEPMIGYWHTMEDGFQGRKPIDDRIAGAGGHEPSQ